ncbi:MAG: hypothetical protein ACSHYB_15465 [Roseibacillus sp.]
MKNTHTLLIAFFALSVSFATARIISPDGSGYTSVSAHPVFSSAYSASNLFDQFLTINEDPGSGSDSGRAWASANSATSAVVEFELDSVQDVAAFAYAQRQFGSGNSTDKFGSVNIWVSETTPFSSFTAPATGPQVSNLSLSTNITDTFKLYALPSIQRGRYFRFEFTNPITATGIPGGTELRLVSELSQVSTNGIISPTGTLYTNVQANSSVNGNYTPDNLFDQTLAVGDDPGNGSDSGRSWAIGSTSVGTVSFQLDRVYDVGALIYAQRQFNDSDQNDKADTVEIWSSDSAPITAEPARSADASLTLNVNVTDTFLSYPFSAPISGRYFFLKFATSGFGLIGGSELRLAPSVVSVSPPVITNLVKRDFAVDLTMEIPPGSFKLQYSYDLLPNSWSDVPGGTFGSELTTIDFRDTHAGNVYPTNGKVFYRLKNLSPQ